MTAVIITKVGTNKNAPRIWLEGRKLEREGFRVGETYSVDASNSDRLTLIKVTGGKRSVSMKKRNGGSLPLIDLNAQKLAKWFDEDEKLRVTIRKGRIVIRKHYLKAAAQERLERIRKKVAEKRKLAVHSIFHGGGVLDRAIHSGLARAGVGTFVQVAVEKERKYLDLSLERNSHLFEEESVLIEAPVQDICLDRAIEADICVMGIPCTGASTAGRAKMRDTKGEKRTYLPEEHDSAGALFFQSLRWIEQTNPALVILENVKPYQSTASMAVIRSVLTSLGYVVQEKIMNGCTFGALENRDRLCVVAVTEGLEDFIDLDNVVPLRTKPAKLSDVLEDIPLDDERWKPYDYLREKEKRDIKAGKGFRRQLFTGEEGHIATVTREYNKARSTDPFIQHPTDPLLSRLLTVQEHLRVKGIPEDLVEVEWMATTTLHEVLGQSVVFPVFEATGFAIGEGLQKAAMAEQETAAFPKAA
ncbi:DNA cytosine methyltransferase [Marinobacter sp. F3R08]|uniref:DNA cytosine methyltransferase n=1 Tax=Marinobacter sp. F3R08 TaxID=2841559 RepID=UPI001C089DD6|nr:DNA cytosine methyltransferase [Marinobacter sp. F3R08]MBU2952292.1 DNA cytosine methyltransferase [Marinobacter sp. F3R08]